MKLRTGDKIDISCTWGDGPDVCVNIRRDSIKCKGYSKGFFPLDLTGDEAIDIGQKLIIAGKQAKEIDDSLDEYYENEKEKDNDGKNNKM